MTELDDQDMVTDPAPGESSASALPDEEDEETRADVRGGVSAPAEPELVGLPNSTSPEFPPYGSRGEAASALVTRGPDMDYPAFAKAAAFSVLPDDGDGPDYDMEAAFADVVSDRLTTDFLSTAAAIMDYDDAEDAAYRSAKASAVAQATGVSPDDYLSMDPSDARYLRMKFLDSI